MVFHDFTFDIQVVLASCWHKNGISLVQGKIFRVFLLKLSGTHCILQSRQWHVAGTSKKGQSVTVGT